MAPTGGPRDKKAPVLLNKGDVDSMLNFAGGKIVIEFDEYIKLDNIQKNFQISPLTKQTPKIKVKKKSLIIELPDSLLEKNTTYNLSFGNAVRDIRESNTYKNLDLTLSTGAYFDSLYLNGKILDAETGKRDSIMIMLYPESMHDSFLLKQKPLYVTKARGGGFSFKGLPNKRFKIAALMDKNANYVYDAIGEKIAFQDKIIDPKKPDSALVLYSFLEDKMKDTSKAGNAASKRMMPKGQFAYAFKPDIKNNKKFDTQDTLRMIIADTNAKLNIEKIRVYEDDVWDFDMLSDYVDSTHTLSLFPHWTKGMSYKVIVQKAFMKDTSGKGSVADTIEFKSMSQAEYASMVVKVDSSLYDENSILYLFARKVKVRSANNLHKAIRFDNLKPQGYKLRILYDENQNGKWDSGSLDDRRQPERNIELPELINLKPNWEKKVDWIEKKKGFKKKK